MGRADPCGEQLMDLTDEAFEELVTRALDEIPPDLAELVENCVVLVEPDAPPDEPTLLGLYDGVPLPDRGATYSAVLPDRILIFRRPLLAVCSSVEDVAREVRTTVIHEVAHHFGIDDDRLAELGWA